MRRRTTERIRRELADTKERLELYRAREKEMLSKDGVQLYTIGSRNLQRYQTSLSSVQAEIHRLSRVVLLEYLILMKVFSLSLRLSKEVTNNVKMD